MIETGKLDVAESSTNKAEEEAMEQEDGEVSDVSSDDDIANDEGEIVEEDADKSGRKKIAAVTAVSVSKTDVIMSKTDVSTSKKTALEKLKNMSFSSRSKLPVRSSSIERRERERKERQTTTSSSSSQQQKSSPPRRDNDEERRQRKRRWEDRSDEPERHQMRGAEERPRPLREAVAATLTTTPLPIVNRPVEPVRPVDQPYTLRQRVEKVISVQESEAVNMSGKELRNLLTRMIDLSKEQQRLLRGRQSQFDTLREMYMEVRGDIEKLYVRVPAQMRMDLPLLPQTLNPSAASAASGPQMNGGTAAAYQLEQRPRIPSLFDPPHLVTGTNARLNPGNDPDVNMRNEGRRAGGPMGFGEMANAANEHQNLLAGRNGALFGGGGQIEQGIHEDMARVGLGSGGSVLRNEDISSQTNAMGHNLHTGLNSEMSVHSASSKRPLFPDLNEPGHLDHPASMVPSTSISGAGPKPLFSRRDFGEGSSRFSGSGPSHELFPKSATDPSSHMDSFSDRPAPLLSFGTAANPNQAAQTLGRPMFDAVDESGTTTYAAMQTNALNKLEPGESDGAVRATGQHNFMQSGPPGPNSFVHPNKPPSPRTVINPSDIDSTRRNACHEDPAQLQHGSFKPNEVLSSSQATLPNLSEPPPPFGHGTVNSPVMLQSKPSGAVPLNTLQTANIMQPLQGAPTPGSVPGSAFPTEHAPASIQPLTSNVASSTLNALSASSGISQNLQSQPGNAPASVASSLLPLHSGSTTVSVPPPDFSVPPPVAPNLSARTGTGAPSMVANLLNHPESASSADSRTRPHSNPPLQRSLSDIKAGMVPNNGALSGLPAMNVPPPSFTVPPPRPPNAGPPFSTPPPIPPGGAASGPRPVNLAPSMSNAPPNLMSGPVGLNCPPPDMSQPPPNLRNPLTANNPEMVQQMVSAMVNQSAMSGQTPVEIVTELIANAYNRAGGVRLPHDMPLKQRMPMALENAVMMNKLRAPAGPPRPLSSVGKLQPPPLMPSGGTRGGPGSRNSNYNKQKGSQNRSSGNRSRQQHQKRQISDMVAIIPDEHDHPSTRDEPDDNIFLIVSDEEDGSK